MARMDNLIRYGSPKFSKRKFQPIRNDNFIKPRGGLWASPIDSEYGWKAWCEDNEFNLETFEHGFFGFDIEGEILVIDSRADLEQLEWVDLFNDGIIWYVDFEALVKKGIDAIHLTVNGERATRFSRPGLYGWDCESVLVMNPDIVIPHEVEGSILSVSRPVGRLSGGKGLLT